MKTKNGFTLVELLVVIAVLAVMATAAVILLDPVTQFQKANDVRRKSDIAHIQKALEQYYQDNGKYPDGTGASGGGACSPFQIIRLDDTCITPANNSWTPYMGRVPVDRNGKLYVYLSILDGQAYYLYASLDRGGHDSGACFPTGDACLSAVRNGAGTACGGGAKCNYVVSSPNVTP